MKFLLDENVDIRLVQYLESQGHDVTAIERDYMRALDDHEVLRIAHTEGRILITNDHDFGDLIVRQREQHAGVVLLRLSTVDLASLIARLAVTLTDYAEQMQHILVVTDQRVRVRRQATEQD